MNYTNIFHVWLNITMTESLGYRNLLGGDNDVKMICQRKEKFPRAPAFRILELLDRLVNKETTKSGSNC